MMIIHNIFRGEFVERPNRFTVKFKTGLKTENAHLRDPGRLKELLTPNSTLILRPALHTIKRKTKYDVLAVLNEDRWVLINSGFHSDIASEIIESGLIKEFKEYNIEKREYTYGKSRLDFLLSSPGRGNKKILLEVKGCTLVENGLAKFPDAPTERGKRHMEELIKAKEEGFKSAVLFLILRDDAIEFTPNWKMDPAFSDALSQAQKMGVEVVVYSFKIELEDDKLAIKPFKRVNIRYS
jgi:sugar fermentation stimulation protein A